jgi:hypothetical protein
MPSPAMLDLARAEDVLGNDADAGSLARYMSLDGAVVTAPHRKTSIATELICLMCARSGVQGQRLCRHCGGSIVVDAAVDLA